jgi:hypothetical protein
VISCKKGLIAARLVFAALLTLAAAVGAAQIELPMSEVQTTVFDETGAVIPGCEIKFRSNSQTILSQTGMDGSVTVRLPNGNYVVTTTKLGFRTSRILDFQIVAPMPDALRVVLKVESISDGPIVDPEQIGVRTITSDVPNVIPPDSCQTTHTSDTRRRTWQCFYLWKCSSP